MIDDHGDVVMQSLKVNVTRLRPVPLTDKMQFVLTEVLNERKVSLELASVHFPPLRGLGLDGWGTAAFAKSTKAFLKSTRREWQSVATRWRTCITSSSSSML
jgi:hypothetical protein